MLTDSRLFFVLLLEQVDGHFFSNVGQIPHSGAKFFFNFLSDDKLPTVFGLIPPTIGQPQFFNENIGWATHNCLCCGPGYQFILFKSTTAPKQPCIMFFILVSVSSNSFLMRFRTASRLTKSFNFIMTSRSKQKYFLILFTSSLIR